jgi:hypothetical protein
MMAICWFALRLLLPVAGSSARRTSDHLPLHLSLAFMAMYCHAPMFSGSSWTQMKAFRLARTS